MTFPAMIRSSFGVSSIFTAGGSGDTISAQEEAIAERGDADFGGSGGQFDAILQFFDALDFANVLPSLCAYISTGESTSEQADSDVPRKPCHFNPPGMRKR